MTTSLNKRIAYLGLADMDYLSARLLLMHGLVTTGLTRAAEALEKLMKLFLLLEAKISRNEELTKKELKQFQHDLSGLLKAVKPKIPVAIGTEWDDLFERLSEAHTHRYPEGWTKWSVKSNLSEIDAAYVYWRNGIIGNFPPEENERVRHFGTFIYDGFEDAVRQQIAKFGALQPGDILRWNNASFEQLDIDNSRL